MREMKLDEEVSEKSENIPHGKTELLSMTKHKLCAGKTGKNVKKSKKEG